MDAYEAPIPHRLWSGRSWLTACCGGCFLGFVVFILAGIFFIRWLIHTNYVPGTEDIQSFFHL